MNGSRLVSETAPSPIWALGAPMDTNTPLGRTLKAQGLVRGPVTIEAIREAYRRNPCSHLAMRQNKRFVFSRDRYGEGGHRVRWDSR